MRTKGFGLIEFLVAVAVIGIVAAISIGVFRSLWQKQSLEKEIAVTLSILEKARNNAINSVSFEEHGVSFASTSVTLFDSTSLAGATSPIVHDLKNVTVSAMNMTGGVTEFYFNKLTGKPSATGTITMTHDDGSSGTIIIYVTGLVEVQ